MPDDSRRMGRAGHVNLLERSEALAMLDVLSAATATGAGQMVLIDGPAGIGKTSLLDVGCHLAEAHGVVVLRARASELERQFAYGVVRQMLEPVLTGLDAADTATAFEGAAEAASFVLGTQEPVERDASFATLHGLYWAVQGLAARKPLLSVVDDLQWADRPSTRFLVHLARRAEGTPVGVLLAMRPRAVHEHAHDDLVEELRMLPDAGIVRPAPLSATAVAAVVGAQLGGSADVAFGHACHLATAGNPFYLHELLNAIDGAAGPAREQVDRVSGLWPASIARSVLRRVGRLGVGATELAAAMAVLGDGGQLRHAAALSGLGQAGGLARGLKEIDVLDDEEPFRFTHPIVRGSIYGDLTPERRDRLHLDAARLLLDDGADPERVASHILAAAAARDAWCVEVLRSSARQATSRGAPENAVTHLRRALAELPAKGPDRLAVLHELAVAEEKAGDVAAVGHLREALDLCEDPRARAEIAMDLARTLETRGLEVEAVAVIRAARAERADAPRSDVDRQLEAALISAGSVDARGIGPDVMDVYGRRLASPPDGPGGQIVLAFAGGSAVWVGAPAAGAAPLALEALELGLLETGHWDAIGACMWALILCERDEAVAERLAELRAAVQHSGHARGLALVHQLEANHAERLGLLAEAESSARLALEIAEDRGLDVGGVSWILCSLVGALVERGDLAEAETALDHMPLDAWPPHNGCLLTLAARGRLRLAQGRPDDALADLLEVGRQYREWPGVSLNGPAPSGWRSSAAIALHQLGRADEAQRLAAEDLAAARVFGTPRPIGVALHAAGTVAPPGASPGLLEQSVDVLRASGARLERARASTALGAALRRSGQRVAARLPLREGLDLARTCGALPLAEFAHQELLAAGARPRRDALSGLGALTASERRVADLAADGLSNRQLAQRLYLSPKTVEMHLSRVYGKLDIPTRDHLQAALAPPPEEAQQAS